MVSRETSRVAELLRPLVASIGIEQTEEQIISLSHHLVAVLAENQRMNLTAITEPCEGVRLHIVDSLLAGLHAAVSSSSNIADIGSGAGFPGIPLAVAFGCDATLVESRRKRASFLESICGDMELSRVHVEAIRAEEYAEKMPGVHDMVLVRAVAEVASLVELSSPLLDIGGRLVAMKGSVDGEEIARGERAAARCGMSSAEVLEYYLPGDHEERRSLVLLTKVSEPSLDLPRRPGRAQKSPLVE